MDLLAGSSTGGSPALPPDDCFLHGRSPRGFQTVKDVGKMDSIYGSKTGIFGTMELSHGLWDRYLLGTYSYRFNLYEYQLNSDLDSTEPLKVKTHALSLGLTYLF